MNSREANPWELAWDKFPFGNDDWTLLPSEYLILRLRGAMEEYMVLNPSGTIQGFENWIAANRTIPELKRRGLFYSSLVGFKLAGLKIPNETP